MHLFHLLLIVVSAVLSPTILADDYEPPQLIELGTVIRNGSNAKTNIDARELMQLGKDARLVSSYISVDVSSTTYTTASFKGLFPFTARGCLPTHIIGESSSGHIGLDSLKTKNHSLNNFQYTVFLIDKTVTSIDQEVLNEFASNKVVVAAFNDVHLDAVKEKLLNSNVVLISNLIRNKQLDASKTYWSYVLVYDAFRNPTGSVPLLANVVLIEKTETFTLCGSIKREGRHFQILSREFYGENPIYPGYERPKVVSGETVKFLDHYGTHIDSPYHLIADGLSTDTIPIEYSFAPCIKVQHVYLDADNVQVGESAFAEWEKTAKRKIPERAIIFVDTGYHKLWKSADKYAKLDSAKNTVNFPGLKPSAVEWLIKNRRVKAVGIDTLSTDPGNSSDLGAHIILAKNKVLGLENVANLDWFPGANGVRPADPANPNQRHRMNPVGKCLLVYLRSEKGTGAPLAIFSHVERDYSSSSTDGKSHGQTAYFTWTNALIGLFCLILLALI